MAATWAASSSVGASTITRTSGSVPLGRIEHPAAAAEAAARPRPTSAATLAARPSPPRTRTLTSTCGSRVIDGGELGERPPGAPHEVEHPEAGQQAVAGGGQVAEDDVTALLAAEAEPAVVERLEHVAVADRRLLDRDAVAAHRQAEAEVGHHGDDDRVVGQSGRDRARSRAHIAMIWSPSTSPPRASTAKHPVGVAVEGEPDVGARGEHRLAHGFGMRRATPIVDVAAVGAVVDHDDVGPERVEHDAAPTA